jgi:cytochrome c553
MKLRTYCVSGVVIAAGIGAAFFGAACGDDSVVKVLPGDGGADGGGEGGTAAQVARGQYLVDHVAACGDCHTPRLMTGAPDMTRYLAGVDCFIGVPMGSSGGDGGAEAGASDAGAGDGGAMGPPGCLNSRNLTNDPTGLKNRTDDQIRTMFQKGTRPNGAFLHPFMPYWIFANMNDDDANAIVAYLRTVPAVEHQVAVNEPPWNNVMAAVPALDPTTIPAAPAGNTSAENGRYLAGLVGACIDCHTPTMGGDPNAPMDRSRFFQGSRAFPAAELGLPSPPFPAVIYSQNLTPDVTGTQSYTVDNIVNILKNGLDRDGGKVCPPMPAGMMAAFGGLTDSDARDIATYVKSLPPVSNMRPSDCVAP